MVSLGLSRLDTRSLRIEEIEAMMERYKQEQELIDKRYALLTYVTSQISGMKKKGGGQLSADDFLLLGKGRAARKMTMEDMERKMKSLTMQMGGKVVGKG